MTKETGKHPTSCLDEVPLFHSLTNEQKIQLYSSVFHKHFERGETIYRPGDVADSLYVMNSGKIRIYRLSDTGKEQLIRILLPGEFTGELALLKEGIYEAYAEAIDPVKVFSIRHKDFMRLLLDFPEISVKMLKVLAGRLGSSEQQTAWVTTETVRNRLIHFLLRSQQTKNHLQLVELGMSKKNLASYLGTTSESLSRELTRLENEGAIAEIGHGVIQLIDLEE